MAPSTFTRAFTWALALGFLVNYGYTATPPAVDEESDSFLAHHFNTVNVDNEPNMVAARLKWQQLLDEHEQQKHAVSVPVLQVVVPLYLYFNKRQHACGFCTSLTDFRAGGCASSRGQTKARSTRRCGGFSPRSCPAQPTRPLRPRRCTRPTPGCGAR